jgi:hypothetical protein
MQQQQPVIAASEKTRVLPSKAFAEGAIISMDLPLDTVLRGLYVRLSGSVVTTYASGTPVAKAESIMDSLISRIDVAVDGGNTIKSMRPHLLHMQQLLASGIPTERFCSAGATAAKDNFPTVEQGFVFGTTGQISTVREAVYIPFEMIYCEPGLGREETYLNLKRATSAEIRFNCASFANLLGFGNTAPVVWSSNLMTIEVSTVERQDVPATRVFSIWKQMQRTIYFAGQTNDSNQELSLGNEYTGFLIFAQDGAPGSAGTATGKLASNLLLTNITFQKNGGDIVQRWNAKTLQSNNRAQAGINASFSSNVSRFDGVYHIDLLSHRDLRTSYPAYKGVVDSLQLVFDTNSATNADYTNPGTVTLVTEELVKPRAS